MTDNTEKLVRELIDQWYEDVKTYPPTEGGVYASAAVRACAKELEHVLDERELIDDPEMIDP